MARCTQCEKLIGADQSTPPHAALRHLKEKKYKTIGWHTGYLDEYRCDACGTKWVLDSDKQDPHAGWSERP